MNLPDNISEEEFLAAFHGAVTKICRRFTFHVYDYDDIYQEAFLIASKGIYSYDASKSVPLEAFLITHLRNRLNNFRRDNYLRIETSCKQCKRAKTTCSRCLRREQTNAKKLGVLSPADLESHPHPTEIPDYVKTLDLEELLSKIEMGLPAGLVEDYLYMKDGVSIPHKRRQAVIEFIKAVSLSHGYIEEEEEDAYTD